MLIKTVLIADGGTISCSMSSANASSFAEKRELGCQIPTVGDESVDQKLSKLVYTLMLFFPIMLAPR